MKNYELITLDNGIRVIHKTASNTQIAHLGIMLDIGSRDELPEEQGIAHFWEHMAFKGTRKRNAFHIINRLESVGGELNAYTTKEKICFYASVLQEHVDRAVELLVDIAFNTTFPEHQIAREKLVIQEEMAMYRDTPEDAIQDDFDELVFENHALGRNILGTDKTVNAFTQKDFVEFVRRNLNTTRIVFSSVGGYDSKKIQRIAKKYLDQIPYKNHTVDREKFHFNGVRKKVIQKPTSQVHVALGSEAYPLGDHRRIPLFMLTNILGGPYMNSRLNMSLREKNGFVYAVEAHYHTFFDTRLFTLFFATDPKHLKKSLRLALKELSFFRDKELSPNLLNKAKQQIKGHLAMSEENNNAFMLMMAKSMLDLNTVPNLESIFRRIDEIQAGELREIARDVFPEQLHSLIYEPQDP